MKHHPWPPQQMSVPLERRGGVRGGIGFVGDAGRWPDSGESRPPTRRRSRSLTSLQRRLVKTGGRLVKRARYYWLMLAESHLTPRLFGSMSRRIEALPAG